MTLFIVNVAKGFLISPVSFCKFLRTFAMNDSSDWNEKFYTNKNNETNIYINGIQINVTTMFDACITKRYFVRSEFDSYFTPELEKMIDLELELI